jgi:hypothetical protein
MRNFSESNLEMALRNVHNGTSCRMSQTFFRSVGLSLPGPCTHLHYNLSRVDLRDAKKQTHTLEIPRNFMYT